MTCRTYTPYDAANELGVRYCGVVNDHRGQPIGFLFNDDNVTGGSFAVLDCVFSADETKSALERLRESFR